MIKIKKLSTVFYTITFLIFILATKVSAAPNSIRIGGVDRYETAVKVSQDSWNESEYVVLASGEDFPDAICSVPLAKKYNAPVLITQGNTLNSKVYDEIKRLKAKQVFIIGGEGVIFPGVEKELNDNDIKTIRIGGQDRYETSVKVAEELGYNNEIILTYGENFPDALSIAPIAAIKNMPIILTDTKVIPDSVEEYINNNTISKCYVLGGTGVVSNNVVKNISNVKRLNGVDRYETNISIINEFSEDLNFRNTYLTSGENFPDALCGSAAAGKIGSPIILTNVNYCKARSIIKLKLNDIESLKVLGGSGVISDKLVQSILFPTKSVLAYTGSYYSGDDLSYKSLVSYSGLIDGIATDTYNIDGLGNITGSVPYEQIEYANANKISTYAMISNSFNGNITKILLESSVNRQNLINNIAYALKKNNYKGVNIDLEGIFYYNRDEFTQFIKDLYNTLNPQGFEVTVSIPSKIMDNPQDAGAGAYDYREIGKFSDKVMIMTYDEHWSGGSPGPIASIGWVEEVINYAVSVIPNDKVMLGLAAYGYDWASNRNSADAYTINQSYNKAYRSDVQVKWDSASKSPYFNYIDNYDVYHSVWFENSTSIGYKLDLVNNYNLAGVAIWRLGLENSDYWDMINKKLNN
ncbi:glycoside hydrolase family 18 [Clostridium sp. P21]|uniref:Glycoside hydrolase family 18 n=1 Tax=Clostridium muellerianum TaxID=2716538 RepID=A0A7Y0HPQ9_9CLOT|nr:cell wall-binding repeat-containing protein [Clostridium muellerianum]NMM63977.1 glycoside hydrolase family 18 [Clostridium muellerianum]